MDLLRIPPASGKMPGMRLPFTGYLNGKHGWSQLYPEVFSYEGPFGVGYLVAGLNRMGSDSQPVFPVGAAETAEDQGKTGESPLVRWARQSLEPISNRDGGFRRRTPAGEMNYAAAALFPKKDGQLRGCIGTLQPVRANLALEIRENAISAGTQDYRFRRCRRRNSRNWNTQLMSSSPPEPVQSIAELDPKRYGVIVRQGSKSGVLLPDLEGVETAQQQVDIAMQKAGIRPGTKVELERFEVRRFY